jgi:hypothetical protein
MLASRPAGGMFEGLGDRCGENVGPGVNGCGTLGCNWFGATGCPGISRIRWSAPVSDCEGNSKSSPVTFSGNGSRRIGSCD